jgi:phosphatidylglycerophosphate synthase
MERARPLVKQVADTLTYIRAALALILAALGWSDGGSSIPVAVGTLILAWSTDALDGILARRSGVDYTTWIGDHDLEVDMMVAGGLLIYLVGADWLPLYGAVLYLVFWSLIFWRWGFYRSLGMLIQAPVYGWFIWGAVSRDPCSGWWLVIWIVAIVVVTWPRFPKEVVPDFLRGMRSVFVPTDRDEP